MGCVAAVTAVLGNGWRAAVRPALSAEAGTVGDVRREVAKQVPRQTIKATGKSLLYQCVGTTFGTGSAATATLAVIAALFGAMLATAALEALRARKSSSGHTAWKTTVIKTLIKSVVSATAKSVIKHRKLCGSVLTAGCGSGVGTAVRNVIADRILLSSRARGAFVRRVECRGTWRVGCSCATQSSGWIITAREWVAVLTRATVRTCVTIRHRCLGSIQVIGRSVDSATSECLMWYMGCMV